MKKLEGARAQDFTLPGSDGKDHSLRDYKGRTVVVYFYPKDDTPGCTKEACGFRDIHSRIQKTGAVVLGVSKDSFVSHGRFIAKHKIPFPLLSDTDMAVMTRYGAWGEKMMYGKKVQGTTRSTVVIGPDGKILKHWPAVKNADQHPEEVLAYLEAIG